MFRESAGQTAFVHFFIVAVSHPAYYMGVGAMHNNALLNMVNNCAAKHELLSTHCESL